ncbi:hypothetical protein JJL53_05480 [Aeromonas media]|nr:hypothetical protein [Aeromonas media]QQQ14573.1 hypothetical protein JJL53_05480 [Aeromonas media]
MSAIGKFIPKSGAECRLQWAYMAIARLGGFMDSKRTGIASWGTLWEGWQTLQSKLDGFIAAKEMMALGIEI